MPRKKKTKVTAIIGAQLGSEGKGCVVYHLRDEFKYAVRTGAPNAGHSFVDEGQLFKMQTIPCTWPNRDCQLVLGAGALINIELLHSEIAMIFEHEGDAHGEFAPIRSRVLIDQNAGILEPRHHAEEGGVEGEIHKRMGSTGEGVGAARIDRIRRDPQKFRLVRTFRDGGLVGDAMAILDAFKTDSIYDTTQVLAEAIANGEPILLEGTQGSGLSLVHGAWPHVTSSDTNAAQLAADAGIPPQHVTDVILVARTYPIRVAGPSGPLKNEVTWEEMSARVGHRVEERTTVTKKIRRVGEWDEALFDKAVRLNAPTEIALTFMDYLDPNCRNQTKMKSLSKKGRDFVTYVEKTWGVPVTLIGTGFDNTAGWTCINRRK